jgi:pimeloyl-ACP methyl ester carboxylesterase
MPWEISGYDANGERVDIRSYFPENGVENFGTRDILEAVEKRLDLDPARFPLHLLRDEVELSESSSGLPWSDPIHRWGGRVVDSPFAKTERYGEISFDEHALIWRGPESNDLCSVSHAQTFFVFAVTPEIETLDIIWRPEPFELRYLPPFFAQLFNPLSSTVFFDIRAYSGQHSSIGDAFRRAWRSAKESGFRVRVKLSNKLGFVTVKACVMNGRVRAAIPTDPSREARLKRLETEFPQHAKQIPDIDSLAHVKGKSAVMFVHGTASCGLLSVAPFNLASFPPDIKWCRFEHDTFLPIDDNATELANKIKARISVNRLLLVGHSRGGLVARAAAAELTDLEVHVWTFGTPHRGTPLIQAAEGAQRFVSAMAALGLKKFLIPKWGMGLLLRMGCKIVSGIPVPDVQTAAWSLFLADRKLPAGFKDMEEGSGWLCAVNRYDPILRRNESPAISSAMETNFPWPDNEGWYREKNYLRTYAGQFDGNTSKKTGYSLMTGSADALFGTQVNDLVVSADSATLGKNYRILADCSHFDFFDDATVQSDIKGF